MVLQEAKTEHNNQGRKKCAGGKNKQCVSSEVGSYDS